ncbi:MAG: hypothetical protein IPH51_18475 [Rubrivivax sp.]|nr:hypothetical protein [Rubrivivax sp.]
MASASSRTTTRGWPNVVDQVCRAVAYDRAVEQGRTEERQRIAQDLHDDIGARLLTLMARPATARWRNTSATRCST